MGRLPNLTGLAVALQQELGWQPTYWITQPELAEQVAQAFPKALLHDFNDANHGRGDPLTPDRLPASDPALLTGSGHLLRQGLLITARHVLAGCMTAPQQMSFYLERLDYALRATKALDLDMFILNSAPHSIIDFAFYSAFKMLDRPVRMLHLTGFRGLQAVLDDAEQLPCDLARISDPPPPLSPESAAELERLFDRSADHTPWYVTRQESNDDRLTRFYDTARELLIEQRYKPHHVDFDQPAERLVMHEPAPDNEAEPTWIARLTAKRRAPAKSQPAEAEYELQNAFQRRFAPKHDEPMRRAFAYRPQGFSAPPITWRHYYTYRDWMLLTKERWRQDYAQRSAAFDPDTLENGPYAYFALHYQPERTTCPEGGMFDDQLLALRLIADHLPTGWRLLVKEHPSQFRWQTEGELGRFDGYYEQIEALPNASLVPLEIASERLIQSASAVVTVTGTVGFEACLGGVPAIVMANPWYAIPGLVQQARTGLEMQQAFARIEQGWRPSRQRMEALIGQLEAIGRRCYLSPSHAPLYPELDEESNLARLIDLFISSERRRQAGEGMGA